MEFNFALWNPKSLPKTAQTFGKPPFYISAAGPALVALSAVLLEPFLTNLTSGREAVLPCIMVALLFALVHPRFRHLLVITLCYGVAFLALRDIFFGRTALCCRLASPATLPSILKSSICFAAQGCFSSPFLPPPPPLASRFDRERYGRVAAILARPQFISVDWDCLPTSGKATGNR